MKGLTTIAASFFRSSFAQPRLRFQPVVSICEPLSTLMLPRLMTAQRSYLPFSLSLSLPAPFRMALMPLAVRRSAPRLMKSVMPALVSTKDFA